MENKNELPKKKFFNKDKIKNLVIIFLFILFVAACNTTTPYSENTTNTNIKIEENKAQKDNEELNKKITELEAKVEDISKQNEELNNEKENLINSSTELNNKITELESKNSELQNQITELTEQKNNLEQQVTSLSKARASTPEQSVEMVTEKVTESSVSYASTITEESSYTVYVTNSGEKYHSSGCRYLKKSSIPKNKSDAISEGYEPCSVCNP